jgi:hypothetical protein
VQSKSGNHAVAEHWVFFHAETWVFFKTTSTPSRLRGLPTAIEVKWSRLEHAELVRLRERQSVDGRPSLNERGTSISSRLLSGNVRHG